MTDLSKSRFTRFDNSRQNEEPNPKLMEALEVVQEDLDRKWDRVVKKSEE